MITTSAGTDARQVRGSTIPEGLSIYLDLIRFLAATCVVLYHTWDFLYPGAENHWPGHEAVVVFFVISGYVIVHAASRPGVTLGVYIQHRVARIVPVAFAALLLGAALALAAGENPLRGLLVNALFLGESGFWMVAAPANAPYWSLNYEVWYYIVFAAWIYAPRRHRMLATVVAAALAGPKILVLMPVWLMGVWLYRHMPAMGKWQAPAVFAATIAAAAALHHFDVSASLRSWLYAVFPPAWRLGHSTQFLYDLILGVVVCLHFAAAASLAPLCAMLRSLERPIRYLAGFTFSAYLFHTPLSTLYVKGMQPWVFYAILGVSIFVLAELTERRVRFYRHLLQKLGTRALPRLRDADLT